MRQDKSTNVGDFRSPPQRWVARRLPGTPGIYGSIPSDQQLDALLAFDAWRQFVVVGERAASDAPRLSRAVRGLGSTLRTLGALPRAAVRDGWLRRAIALSTQVRARFGSARSSTSTRRAS